MKTDPLIFHLVVKTTNQGGLYVIDPLNIHAPSSEVLPYHSQVDRKKNIKNLQEWRDTSLNTITPYLLQLPTFTSHVWPFNVSNFSCVMKVKHLVPWPGFEFTTLVVIGTDCIDSCKSNYHSITTTMTPYVIKIKLNPTYTTH
jgi:hypothetical protein